MFSLPKPPTVFDFFPPRFNPNNLPNDHLIVDVNEKAVEHFRQYTFQENLVDYVKEAQKRTAAQTEYMKKVIDDTKNNKKLNEKADESYLLFASL